MRGRSCVLFAGRCRMPTRGTGRWSVLTRVPTRERGNEARRGLRAIPSLSCHLCKRLLFQRIRSLTGMAPMGSPRFSRALCVVPDLVLAQRPVPNDRPGPTRFPDGNHSIRSSSATPNAKTHRLRLHPRLNFARPLVQGRIWEMGHFYSFCDKYINAGYLTCDTGVGAILFAPSALLLPASLHDPHL